MKPRFEVSTDMKFMIQVIDDSTGSASGDEMDAITNFNNELRTQGNFLMAEGLQSPKASSLIDNRNNTNAITEGPLIDSKEFVSGFWIIEAKDLAQAKSLASQASLACNRKVELRPFIQ